MALIHCPGCGKDVSDQASACIHCGYPLRGSHASQEGTGAPQSEHASFSRTADSEKEFLEPQHSQTDDGTFKQGIRTARSKKGVDINRIKTFFLGFAVGIVCGVAITIIWAFLYDGSSGNATQENIPATSEDLVYFSEFSEVAPLETEISDGGAHNEYYSHEVWPLALDYMDYLENMGYKKTVDSTDIHSESWDHNLYTLSNVNGNRVLITENDFFSPIPPENISFQYQESNG